MAGRELFELAPALHPTAQDLAGIMRALRARAGDDEIDPETWRDLLLLGRTAEGLPSDLRTAAVECARGDAELLSILDRMSESHAAEWEAKRAERNADREMKRRNVFRAHRHILSDKSEEVSCGDVHALSTAATVYLGWTWALPAELHLEPELPPHERLRAILGDALAERVMTGFIATLHRDDLPNAERIAQAHSENEICIAEAPTICGVAEMLRLGRPFEGADRETLAAAYMAWRLGPESDSAELYTIGEALEGALFHNDVDWEPHFRTSIEPYLDGNHHDPGELHRLTHETRFTELAGRLSVDWLRRYPALNLHIQTKLLACALKHAQIDAMRALLIEVRDRAHPDRATQLSWLSADYIVNLEDRRSALEAAAREYPDFIWSVRDRIAPRDGERFDECSLEHLVFVVEAFGQSWPNVPTPTGVTIMGDCDPSDASKFIRRTINTIAGIPSPEATGALQSLIGGHASSYVDTTKHALALQRRVRRDHEYSSPGIEELRAVVKNDLPESIDDMRAWLGDAIETLQRRIRSSDTDMWEAYWDGDVPKCENYCRDRLVEHIGSLPESIRFGPETHMPAGKRVDIALTHNRMKLPVEVKGQWHRDVWNAAVDQLDSKYTVDWQAEGRGVYTVLWFGDVPDKQLPGHPEGLESPESPDELRRMLIDRLTEDQRGRIDVFVIDVSRPRGSY